MRPTGLALALIALIGTAATCTARAAEDKMTDAVAIETKVVTYPAPEGITPSGAYAVEVGGKPVFVYTAQVLHNGPASFAYFDFAGTVAVKVEVQSSAKQPREVKSVAVRPISYGIKPTTQGNTISFSLSRPCNLSVEVNGPGGPLLLFANPIEKDPPKPDDPNVVYFGPGIHEVGTTELKSGQTVYVAGGAIVKGIIRPGERPVQERNWAGNKVYENLFVFKDAKNVHVRGRGILDMSGLPWHSKCPIVFTGCTDFGVEGIIIKDSPCWCAPMFSCKNGRYVNIKQICHRENSDGINIVNSQDIVVDGCFLRNNDDEICVKTTSPPPAPEAKNITVTNCVVWNDRAYGIGITYETRANISNVLFKDCDVIHDWGIASLAIHVSDSATMSGIRFEDIRVEDARSRLVRLWIGGDMWGHDPGRGHIRGVVFKNISVTGAALPVSEITGFDPDHKVEDVLFDHLRVDGKLIHDAAQAKLSLRHAANVRFVTDSTPPEKAPAITGSKAAGVGKAAEPKTAYFFGHPENASGFVAWIVSPRAGLCFTDGEPLDVRVRVGGANDETTVDFNVTEADGPFTQTGKLTFAKDETERPLPLLLPGRGLFNVTVKAASGKALSQAAAPVAVVFPPRPADEAGAWGGIYTHPGSFDPNYPNQVQDSVRSMRVLGAGACRLPFWAFSFGKVTVADGKASADFAFWKTVATALRKEGIFILGNPCQMPKELSSQSGQAGQEGDGGPAWCRVKPADYRLWDQLMEQMAGDFRNEISVWEMWNEPDLFYWKGTPEEYVELVAHTAAAIRRGNPNAKISAGSFASAGSVGRYLSLGLGKHIDILTFHYSDESHAAWGARRELEKLKLNMPMWNTEERNEIPLRNLADGVERTFKFANTVDGYEGFRPVTRPDFTVRPPGIWFSVGAHCIGSGKCVGASDKLVPGCEVYFFQRGDEKIVAFRNSAAPAKLLDPNRNRAKRVTLKLEPLAAGKPVTATDVWGRSRTLDIRDGGAEFPLADGYTFINGARAAEIVKAELPPAQPQALVFEAERGKWSPGWGNNGHAGYSENRLLEIWTKTEPGPDGYWAEVKFSAPADGKYELIFAGTTLEGLTAGKSWLSAFAWAVDGGAERKVESPLPVIKNVAGAPQGVSVLEVLDLKAGEHTFRLRLLRKNDPPNDTWAMWFDAIALRPRE